MISIKRGSDFISKVLSSWAAIEAAIQKEMYAATKEAVNKSFQDLQENVDYFYDSPGNPTSVADPPPGYDRTGQLMASPQLDGINFNGNSAIGQISINTGTQYDPAGRDTHTIYEYAEEGGLLGNGGFWQKTLEQIKENMNEAFSKRFN